MAERPAVDASPLIQLADAQLLDFLQLAGPEIVVPRQIRYTNAFALLQPKVANPRKWSAETPDRTLEAANVQCAQLASAFIPLFGRPRLPDVWELP